MFNRMSRAKDQNLTPSPAASWLHEMSRVMSSQRGVIRENNPTIFAVSQWFGSMFMRMAAGR